MTLHHVEAAHSFYRIDEGVALRSPSQKIAMASIKKALLILPAEQIRFHRFRLDRLIAYLSRDLSVLSVDEVICIVEDLIKLEALVLSPG